MSSSRGEIPVQYDLNSRTVWRSALLLIALLSIRYRRYYDGNGSVYNVLDFRSRRGKMDYSFFVFLCRLKSYAEDRMSVEDVPYIYLSDAGIRQSRLPIRRLCDHTRLIVPSAAGSGCAVARFAL